MMAGKKNAFCLSPVVLLTSASYQVHLTFERIFHNVLYSHQSEESFMRISVENPKTKLSYEGTTGKMF